MIRYKVDVLDALRDAGVTQYRIKRDRIFGQRNTTQLRRGELVSWSVLDKVCTLLHCQPGDIVEWVPDPVPSGPEDGTT